MASARSVDHSATQIIFGFDLAFSREEQPAQRNPGNHAHLYLTAVNAKPLERAATSQLHYSVFTRRPVTLKVDAIRIGDAPVSPPHLSFRSYPRAPSGVSLATQSF
jgi:hypothetical protein